LVTAVPYLAAWRCDYPYEQDHDALVFVSRYGTSMNYNSITKQINEATTRAGITKHVTPHLFRHSRVTNLLQQGVHESIIKEMFWGNQDSKMLSTYGHLTDNDVDNAMLAMHGMRKANVERKDAMTAKQCPFCHTINGSIMTTCVNCGRVLSGETNDIEELTMAIENHPMYQVILKRFEQKYGSHVQG
jgi:hypothetical protein